jgi:hypothetical protein
MEKSFKDEFFCLAKYMGGDAQILRENLGPYDDIEQNEHRAYVWFKDSKASFYIGNDAKVGWLSAPIANAYGNHYFDNPQYYNIDGLFQGMTKYDVEKIWGAADSGTNEESLVWRYTNLGGVTNTGERWALTVSFEERGAEYVLSNFGASLVISASDQEDANFEDQFIQLCRLLGSNYYNIINEIGEPDEVDRDENGKQFLYYDSLNILFTIPADYGVAELIAGPAKPDFSKKNNGNYSFYGVELGDTRNDVLGKWGKPTNEHPFVWCYGNKTGTTHNGYHFEIRALWDNDNPNILQGFGAMLYDFEQQSIVHNEKPKSGCFIATVCYGNYEAKEVIVLRHFRDTILLKSYIGKLLVVTYYFLSPPLAKFISKYDLLKNLTRKFILSPIILRISKRINL